MIDTHCHLNLAPLVEDVEGALRRALDAGVRQAIVIGIDLPSSRLAVEQAHTHEELFAVVGVHPTAAGRVSAAEFREIVDLADDPKVVALGESGLDFHWDDSTPAEQEAMLALHVEEALRRDLPLVLHIRDAYPEAARRLEPAARDGLRGVVHCFAGTREEAAPFVEWGWPLGLGGILTYRGAEEVRAVAAETPGPQLLLETDSPWLTPRHRGRETNEPAFVRYVAQELARVRRCSLEEIDELTTTNAKRTFDLP
ncbi:MAG: TatD family hydrolase [Acidobacteriota bacterium]